MQPSLGRHADDALAAARAGDGVAWGRFLEHYRPYLTLLAEVQVERLLRGKADPADLVQEAFLQAHQDFPAFRGTTEGEFVAWLLEILATRLSRLTRRYLDTQKRDARRERELYQSLADSSRVLHALLVAPGSTPSQRAGRREDAVRLAAALDRLSADHRQVLVLRHMEGLSFAEVGGRMGRTTDAATKLWGRAVRALRTVMGEDAG